MKKVSALALKEGDCISRDIITPEGKLLLKQGTTLNTSHINSIRRIGIPNVFIKNLDLQIDLEGHELISTNMRWELNKATEDLLDNFNQNKVLDGIKIKKIVGNIVVQILNKDGGAIQLSPLSNYQNYSVLHSVNSCILSVVLGRHLGYNPGELYDLGVGVLLQDIGMAQIPEQLVNKQGKYTEEEFERIKKHCSLGYEILSSSKDVSMLASLVALQHHERWDGTGYPNRLRKNEISEYALIASLMDVYDALTAERPYRKRMLPHEAYEYFMAYGGVCFNLGITQNFLNKIILYPNGSWVRINNGDKGIIYKQNPQFPSRPVIMVPEESDYKEVDLLSTNSLMIAEVLEEPE